ncbi:MAG: SDR family oxidoreductase [Planctomycetaceae bacterium]
MSQRVLVLGCGYLGRRVAVAWHRRGDRVHAMTRSSSRAESFRRQGLEPVVGDVTDPASLVDLPTVDVVLFAVGRDRERTSQTMREVSLDGLRHVLDVMQGRCGRFLFVSSTGVYGQSDGEWVDEESACDPARENGRVLVEAESEVRDRLGNRASLLRLAGLYGPDRLISRRDTLRSTTPLAGDPRAWLNLIHVDDAAAAVIACGDRDDRERTWLACDDRPVRREEFFGKLAELFEAPPPTFDVTRAGSRIDGIGKRCCNRRLRRDLGLSLEFPSIDEGLPAAVAATPETPQI